MIPARCPGLIPCTPIPTPRPIGLTHDEAVAVGNFFGDLFGFLAIFGLVVVAIAFTYAIWIATRNP